MSGPLISPIDPPVQFSGHLLRVLRTEARYKQTELASKLDVQPGTVRDWENDRYRPSVERLCALAVLLDCRISAMFIDTRVPAEELEVSTS